LGDVPDVSSQGIFLSYRREDSGPYARMLKTQLDRRFPRAQVFMDVDSIEPGLDFAEVIREKVDSCAVLLALIGRQWATLTDKQEQRRLDNPEDLVRSEIRAALEGGLRVIPVLIDGAQPPRLEQLPPELQKLARLNSLELSYSRYEYDEERLLGVVERLLTGGPGTAAEFSPAVDDKATVSSDVQPDANAAGQPAQQGLEVHRKDPTRIDLPLAAAKRAADSITDQNSKARALAEIVWALAPTHPDRAEDIARAIPDGGWKVRAFTEIAKALAATDPDRAERIAQTITGAWKAAALAEIAQALAATHPDRAERIAQTITDGGRKAYLLAGIAKILAATDPDRAQRLGADAENIVQSIIFVRLKASLLADIANTLAAADPDRAERIAQTITGEAPKARALAEISRRLAATDPDRAERLGAHAERIAGSVADESFRARLLSDIARTVAAADPDRAERIAQSISDPFARATTLVTIARATPDD
jgi:hypothetical protein